jgi:lysophospholipase L1-like esterase
VWDLSGSFPALRETPFRIPAIFIGDSITWQWARTSRTDSKGSILIPLDPLPSYMTVSGDNVTTRFHPGFFTGNGYLDKGVSGQNTTQMLTRFQKDVIDLNPQVVVIMGGTNDLAQGVTKQQIVENIAAMAEMADDAGIKVVICTVTPCNDSYSRLSDPKTKGAHIITLNGMLQEYAASKNFSWCDYWSSLVAEDGLALDAKYWLYDHLHPNPDAYSLMEGIVKPIIDSQL